MLGICQSGGDIDTTGEPSVADNRQLLALLSGIAEAFQGSVGRNTEIVVHDLLKPESSIVQIVNGHVSNRRVGQPIIVGLSDDIAFDEVVGIKSVGPPNDINIVSNYTTHTEDGRALRSSSVMFRDEAGRPVATLCINVDTNPLERLQRDLQGLFAPSLPTPEPTPINQINLEELVKEIIDSAINSVGAPVSRMKKIEKMAVVAKMHERGLFLLRGSVELVAKHLGTTKFTIYNYLEEIGESRTSPTSAKK